MRKLLSIIALSTSVFMASCDMDKMPQGYLDSDPEVAFKDIDKIEAMELGTYARLRDNYITSNMIAADIQADYVHAKAGFSNTFGDMYKWSFVQQDNDITATWNRCYLTIAMCNYILDNTVKLIGDGEDTFDGDALSRLEVVRGRVFFMRALSYSTLVERFCADYNEATAKNPYTGVPLITSYTPDNKPGRATLFAVYEQIQRDIDAAKIGLANKKGAPNSIYLNIDCVTAFQARVYLQMDMHPEALATANLLINDTKYNLVANLEEFEDIWSYDKGNEVIFKFAASTTELPDPFGQSFFYDQSGGTGKVEGKSVYNWGPDYIPTQTLIDSFKIDPADDKEVPKDYRYQSWFFGGWADNNVYQNFWAGPYIIQPGFLMLAKFPGNPDLRTTANAYNYANAWKLFRIAEMYLIAAEAAAQTGKDAKTPLNALREHRGLEPLDVVTMKEVKEERYKELMLEGFRITDLKRWGEGFTRGKSQEGTFYKLGPKDENGNSSLDKMKTGDLAAPVGVDLTVSASDFRFIWPIPFSEIYANQNLASQQNPGWVQ